MVVGLLAAGCADDSDDGAGPDATGGAGRADEASVPLGTEPTAVEPYVSELLLAYDRVVNEIVADPTVADDPDDPSIQEFLGLFDDGSTFAATMVDLWVERAEEGLLTLPYSEDYPALASSLDGAVETISADEVSFPLCVMSRTRVLDSAGEEAVPSLPRLDHPGEGVAVRTDDGWLLQEVQVWTDQLQCREGEA